MLFAAKDDETEANQHQMRSDGYHWGGVATADPN
jgi:hypothetical protein